MTQRHTSARASSQAACPPADSGRDAPVAARESRRAPALDQARASREAQWSALMRGALGGDQAGYRQLLLAMTPHLRAVARRQCERQRLSSADAEDVVQDALLAIHLKRATWDPSRPIGPWIAAILHHKLVDTHRRRGFRIEIPIEAVSDVLAAEGRTDDLDHYDVDRMLGRLNERQRSIVRFVAVDGLSAQEAAARLGMREGAVRVALHRALKTLSAMYRRDEA